MSKLMGTLLFVAGAVAGALGATAIVKEKYALEAELEIQEMREYYRKKEKERIDNAPTEEIQEPVEEVQEVVVEEEEERREYKAIVEDRGYTNYQQYTKEEQKESNVARDCDEPYVIEPEEFGEDPEYDTMTLTLYADGVIVDDVDDIVDEPDVLLGAQNLKIFEEFDARTVYVRNDIWRMDYEIIRDDWFYSDLQDVPAQIDKKPHQL